MVERSKAGAAKITVKDFDDPEARAMHNCRRPTCHGVGYFSAAAAPANRTRCRQQCIPRCALA